MHVGKKKKKIIISYFKILSKALLCNQDDESHIHDHDLNLKISVEKNYIYLVWHFLFEGNNLEFCFES